MKCPYHARDDKDSPGHFSGKTKPGGPKPLVGTLMTELSEVKRFFLAAQNRENGERFSVVVLCPTGNEEG